MCIYSCILLQKSYDFLYVLKIALNYKKIPIRPKFMEGFLMMNWGIDESTSDKRQATSNK